MFYTWELSFTVKEGNEEFFKVGHVVLLKDDYRN